MTRLMPDEEQGAKVDSEEPLRGTGKQASVVADPDGAKERSLLMEDDEPFRAEASTPKEAPPAEQNKLDDAPPGESTAQKANPSLAAVAPPSPLARNDEARERPLKEAPALASPSPASGNSRESSVLEEVPQGELDSPIKLAHYRFVLASTTYETSPSKQHHIERIASLERLTQVACMRKMLNTLTYRDPPQEPLCIAAFEKLLSLNPGSTSATCARDGIDSPSCLTADSDTTTRTDSSKEGGARGSDPSSKKLISLNERLSENLKLIRNGARGVSEEQRVTARAEATELASQVLNIACAGAKVFVRERPVVQVRDFSKRKDPYGLSELLERQERLRGGRPKTEGEPTDRTETEPEVFGQRRGGPSPAGALSAKPSAETPSSPLGLVYLVSSDCASAMSTARSLDPALPALVCAERGRYSPRCIQAIRASQSAAKGRKRSADEFRAGEEGFSRF